MPITCALFSRKHFDCDPHHLLARLRGCFSVQNGGRRRRRQRRGSPTSPPCASRWAFNFLGLRLPPVATPCSLVYLDSKCLSVPVRHLTRALITAHGNLLAPLDFAKVGRLGFIITFLFEEMRVVLPDWQRDKGEGFEGGRPISETCS